MSRIVEGVIAVAVLGASVGCCAGPCRFYENAYGWNNPDIERYCPGPPPPVTTPPGYSSPVVPEQVIASTGKTSPGVAVPPDAAPPTEVLPEQVPVPDDSPGEASPEPERTRAPTSLKPEMVVPASYNGPTRLPPIDAARPRAVEAAPAGEFDWRLE